MSEKVIIAGREVTLYVDGSVDGGSNYTDFHIWNGDKYDEFVVNYFDSSIHDPNLAYLATETYGSMEEAVANAFRYKR